MGHPKKLKKYCTIAIEKSTIYYFYKLLMFKTYEKWLLEFKVYKKTDYKDINVEIVLLQRGSLYHLKVVC